MEVVDGCRPGCDSLGEMIASWSFGQYPAYCTFDALLNMMAWQRGMPGGVGRNELLQS